MRVPLSFYPMRGESIMEANEAPTEIAPGVATDVKARKHRATYATDKRNGGYLVRVSGPTAGAFAGRVVPVNTKAGGEHLETLVRLVWSGNDLQTGEPVALYTFASKPRDTEQTAF